MKPLLPILFALPFLFGFQTQKAVIDCDQLAVNGLKCVISRHDIYDVFGLELESYEPNYECGFYSSKEQGTTYYSLRFKHVIFTGNNEEGYFIDKVVMDPSSYVKITYKGKLLSHTTTVQQFEAIFGTKVDGESCMLFFKGADDALLFTFENNLLRTIEYWSPC